MTCIKAKQMQFKIRKFNDHLDFVVVDNYTKIDLGYLDREEAARVLVLLVDAADEVKAYLNATESDK